MTSASKILMGGGGSGAAYEIEQSLNFNWGDDSAVKRTVSTTSNRRTWTTSMWIKRHTDTVGGGTAHTYGVVWGSDDGAGAYFTQLNFTTTGQLEFTSYHYNLGAIFRLITNRIFRDVSAWFHLVFTLDTTQGTAANRMKMYINGVEETSFSSRTDPAQNRDSWVNLAGGGPQTQTMVIGNGYLTNANNVNYQTSFGIAEHNFIDGIGLTPSAFGETKSDTGQWIPKKYSGSYGTNGYYLKFASGAIGTDSSGEGNNMSLVSVINSDVVTDSPTNNFCTLNPAMTHTATTISEGNLKSVQSNHSDTMATFKIPHTGKWYFECVATTAGGAQLGIAKTSYQPSAGNWVSTTISLIFSNGQAGTGSGSTYIGSAISNGNTVGVAIDSDNGKIYFAKNNTWGNSGNPLTGANPAATFTASDDWQPIVYGPNGAVQTFNFGQKDFAYTPPSGFLTLSTNNLPDPAVTPSEHFNTVTYTGDGSTNNDISGVGFQPDFVWIKNRSQADSHVLNDAVRGAGKTLYSDLANAEANNEAFFGPFQTDGFRLAPTTVGHAFNASSENYVAWNWKAGGTAPVKTYVVKVVSDSGNKYRFDDFAASAQTVDMQEGGTYTFDQSDSSNSNHPLRFSTTSNGTHGGGSEYTTGVVTYGTPGNSGAYTRITVAASTPTLYYYCTNHSNMGGQANTNSLFGSSYFDGDIKSTVSANVDAGFSVLTFTGSGSGSANDNDTVPHGLGVVPDFVWYKSRVGSSWENWIHSSILSGNKRLLLQSTAAVSAINSNYLIGGEIATSSMISNNAHTTSQPVVAWCFASKEGFSKIGVYTGTGNSNTGPFVNTGFRPAWLMVRRTDSTGFWRIYDSKRTVSNPAQIGLYPNTNAAEDDGYYFDLLSNGFRCKSDNANVNASGGTYLYMAFAESPFKTANAR